jgi:hypothetical protein
MHDYLNNIYDKYYYKDGTSSNIREYNKILHRIDGPAVENSTGKYWIFNGKFHRADGPAIEYQNGSISYYINGALCFEEHFNKYKELIKLIYV